MGFQQGLSGLNVSAKALDAIGNNVSNANTVGFKAAAVRFADVFASSLSGVGGAQIGIGSNVAGIAQQFTQGNITSTNNTLDLAINGSGMYRMSGGGTITYTRSGQFSVDKDGYIVGAGGQRLTGYAADNNTIVPGNFVDLRLTTTNIPPKVTEKSQLQLNLDSRATAPTQMTQGMLAAGQAFGGGTGSVTIAAATPNNQLDLWVDGKPVSVTIPDGTYTATEMATTLTTLINTALGTSGATVEVTATSGGLLQFTSNSRGTVGSLGNGSSISISASSATGDLGLTTQVGGPTVGVDGPPATGGQYVGIAAITFPLTVTKGQNDTFSVVVDGAPHTVTLPPGIYNDPPTGTGTPPADDLVGQINLQLGTAGTATLTAGVLDIASATTGAGSAVFVTGGNAVAGLFGARNGEDKFDPDKTLSYTASTAQTVYDSLGNPHNLTLYFAKTSEGNTWQMYTTLDKGGLIGPTLLKFNASGILDAQTPMPLMQQYTLNNGALPLSFELDLTGTTQYGISFGVNQLLQDGYSSGQLAGLSVAADGTIQGNYSNGKSQKMGQVILVSFNNPNGLLSLGGNQWAETADSGQPIPGTPGQGRLGAIQSAAIEESNVDLTKELVDMITQQRVYQANAQTIKTQDSVLQTLVNLR